MHPRYWGRQLANPGGWADLAHGRHWVWLTARANSYAERWVRTVRAECLDWTLVFGRRHLETVLREYVSHYNEERPHRGVHLAAPAGSPTVEAAVPIDIGCRDVLGGLIHEYHPVPRSPYI